jgi:hypothetical protein
MSQIDWNSIWIEKLRIAVKTKGFSPQTFSNYRIGLELFLNRHPVHPNKVPKQAFAKHLAFLLEEKKLAESTVNLHREALRFFYQKVLEVSDPLKTRLYAHLCGRKSKPPQWKSIAIRKFSKFRNPRASALSN